MIWTRHFWKDAAERAIKTAAQVAASFLSAEGMGLFDADWTAFGSVVGMSFVLSVLTSVASAPVGQRESGSILK